MNISSLPSTLLEGKTITLCVTGSISAYKALELLRLFVKTGAKVKVVMSEGAKAFVTPLSFEALSGNKVLHHGAESWSDGVDHIRYAQGCDVMVVAPASANTLNKLAHGYADTLVTQTVLASTVPVLVAPAANTAMIQAPVTQNALEILAQRGVTCIQTQVKSLACATTGDGALAEPVEIFWQTARALLSIPSYKDRSVVVTAGGTIEKIDDVRYLSNFSSGKMGRSLAVSAYLLGANVTLMSSVGNFSMPQKITLLSFTSTQELKQHLEESLTTPSTLFMAAAVADFIPKETTQGKIKKSFIGSSWELSLVENIDLLSTRDKKGHTIIGFKAESDLEKGFSHAQNMLTQKGLDGVCLNYITKEHSPFGSSSNAMTLITPTAQKEFPLQKKLPLSLEILKEIATL